MSQPRLTSFLIAIGLSLAGTQPALAWGSTGHRMVGVLAAEQFPAEMPRFLRTRQVATDIGELARELDRSKGAGRIHDSNLDPGHFVDIDDNGGVFGGPKMSDLPPTRAAYEAALSAAGSNSWQAGYSPYVIVEGWQQLVKDFTHWRILAVMEKREKNPARRSYYRADRIRREALIVRNIGIWAHYVGDGSQPLHDTWHYNGWGKYPNPKGWTLEPIHGPFEADFVRDHVKIDAVRTRMAPYRDCRCAIEKRTADYLLAGNAQVETVYALWKDQDIQRATPRAVEFATGQVAKGAAELRDMVFEAWKTSATGSIGYRETAVTPAEAASGAKDPWLALWGDE
jgi:hypothetical protein